LVPHARPSKKIPLPIREKNKIEEVPIAHVVVASRGYRDHRACCQRCVYLSLDAKYLLTYFTLGQTKSYALHQLITIDKSSNTVIRLKGYDTYSNDLKYYIVNCTTNNGNLFQLSSVYSNYGYEPIAGTVIKPDIKVAVTGSQHRIYYTTSGNVPAGKWDTISFIVNNGQEDSYEGYVTIVPLSGAIVTSEFLLNSDDWTITGNKAVTNAVYESYSRGNLLNHYIYGTDDKINTKSSDNTDNSLWFFEAPAKYLGNYGIAYGGNIKYTLGAFSGDFSKLNSKDMPIVELECKTCDGPVSKGIKLIFPLSSLKYVVFNGAPTVFTIPLLETSGWLKDPQNTLSKWSAPSKCDLIQVLSRLSAFRILGDWTTWYESVALDNVSIMNTKGQIPICASSRTDASVCTC
jgi:hypothetical protein